MPARSFAGVRRLLSKLHLWVSVALFLPLIPLGLTGAVLAWPEALNQATNPPPHVRSASAANLPLAAYISAARKAAPRTRLQSVRLPALPGAAVSVVMSTGCAGPAGSETVWLDPGTAKVLKIAISTSPLFALSHDLHGHFLVPGVGRQFVGYAGVAMLIIALTGFWLWWPSSGGLGRGLQWRRTPDRLMNLHHVFGFWISLPLAFVSVTGILISFPSLTAALLGGLAAPSQVQRPAETRGRRDAPRLDADQALATALAAQPGGQPAAVTLPRVGGRGAAAVPPGIWQVELFVGDRIRTVQVDDASGALIATPMHDTPSAVTPRQHLRELHAGRSSLAWRLIVTLTGLFPLILAATGVYAWARREWRKARSRRETASATV